jgi:uncharacterized membrane protein
MSGWRNCLTCNWLGERVMGQDVDDLLAYQTPKVVKIKDRMLGMLKIIFMLIIFSYVVVFQLAYKGSHFQLESLSGIARLQLQHPTKKCNPMAKSCKSDYASLQNLPYCSQYTGKDASMFPKKCKYFDALDLLTPMDGGYLIPSFVQMYDMQPSCTPNAGNNYRCDKKYEFVDNNGDAQKGPGRAKPKGEFYVADMDSFTILLDHSFRVETGSVEYDDYKMQGYWLDCSDKQWSLNSTWLTTAAECEKKPIICKHSDCKKIGMVTEPKKPARKHRKKDRAEKGGKNLLQREMSRVGTLSVGSAQDEGMEESDALSDIIDELPNNELFSLKVGDVLSMRTLFRMAGRSLDQSWYDPSEKANVTARKRGTVLVVNIHYNNLRPWTLFRPQNPPEYTISVTPRPVDKYKHMSIAQLDDGTRELTVAYGTLVIVQSTGTIAVFSMIHMLIVFSTSLGLLAASSVITDILALNVLPMKDEYTKAKYQETEDFHDLYASRVSEGMPSQ